MAKPGEEQQLQLQRPLQQEIHENAEGQLVQNPALMQEELRQTLQQQRTEQREESGIVTIPREREIEKPPEAALQTTLHLPSFWQSRRIKTYQKLMQKIISVRAEMDMLREQDLGRVTEATAKKIFALKKKIVGYRQEIAEIKSKNAGTYDEMKKREIKAKAAGEMAELCDELIQATPEQKVKERNALYKQKEKIQVRQHKWLKRNKIERLTDPVERERELNTFKRHEKFDALKTIFYKPTKMAIEGATYDHNGMHLVNVGRAFMGGTKPMYYFEDRNAPILDKKGKVTGYKKYLYKEAVNCIGRKKVQGALVTEAASKLQQKICGEYAIDAFAAKDEKGVVMGSFQVMIEQPAEKERIDLFKWQASPKDTLSPMIKNEILREHTLDWLLCNFDTKGENFLHRKSDGHLSSFDKEASFSFIEDADAQHMSTTYMPHSNDTLYNTVFQQYINGTLDLDFTETKKRAETIRAMSDDEYIGMFEEMLRQKYTNKEKYEHIKGLILARKKNLVDEYNSFIDKIEAQRKAHKKQGKAA